MQPFVDGILATPDIMEELWMLQSWVTSQGGPEFLAGKVLIGSMNRAGLTDTVFELDDFVSAYTPESLLNSAMDAGKLLLRLDPSSELSSRTLRHVCEALIELDRVGLPVFLEPIPVPVSVDDLVRLIGVASALGPSSRHRWLKVPMVESFDRVSRATTCPLVLLGGPNTGPSPGFVNRVRTCLAAGPNVRGILMGRAVLYPGDGSDPREVMAQLASLIKGREFKEVIQWEAL
jgi:DhnA family fructose-bisphosphate aldolase class Ia